MYSSEASPKQISFIESLLEKRETSLTIDPSSLTKSEASALIAELLNAPYKSARSEYAPTPTVEEGMYRRPSDNAIFRVMTAKTSSNRYAKKLDQENGGWDYEKGAIYTLKPEFAMTLDQAKEFGVESGVCCVCARTLTNPDSIAAGIGPICAGIF